MTFKPMLAAKATNEDIERLLARGPAIASPKIDGVRAIVRNGVLVSRSLKPIRNHHVQQLFGHLEGLDGELVVGEPTAKDCMQRTTSGVMRADGEPAVTFWVFDLIGVDKYSDRLEAAAAQAAGYHTEILEQAFVYTLEGALKYEGWCLAQGYEGIMLRDPQAPYKFGRSTAKEGGLLKVKRFEDAEAVVVGFEERMHNANEAKTNALGRTERSSHKDNLAGRGDLGALVARLGEIEFNIGTGFTDDQRQQLWAERDTLCGRLVKFRHFAAAGVKGAPRFPVFVGFRAPEDM